jgi:hypothetical protein
MHERSVFSLRVRLDIDAHAAAVRALRAEALDLLGGEAAGTMGSGSYEQSVVSFAVSA